MSSVRLLAICLLACAVFAARPAWAQAPGEPPPGDASPHGGRILRLRLGPAYLSTAVSKIPDLGEERYSGVGVAFDAEIGRSLTPTVTVCAELSGAVVPHATELDSGDLESTPIADLETVAFGASFTYTNPWNFYVAVNPAFMTLLINYHGRDGGAFDLGPEIGFVVGGEWRVSSGWRLGLAGEARYAAMWGAQTISTMSQYALFLTATHG